MSKLDLGQAEYLFECSALSEAMLRVFRFRGREHLNQSFEFLIDLVSPNPDVDLDAAIGQPAVLTLLGRHFTGVRYSRYVHGVIERFVQLGAGSRHSRYQAVLVPTLKPLAYSRDSRIFQQKSVPDVTQQVLQDHGVPAATISRMLHGTYAPRDYCVQYQESPLTFIQRLWEEEGICYFFEHERDKDTVVLGDGKHAFPALSAYAHVEVRDQPHLYEEGLFEFRSERSLQPGATVLRDFRFKQPTLDMEASVKGERFAERAMYFFPGEYVDPDIGQKIAKVRLEEQQSQRARFVAAGNVRAMLPGHTFTLSGHRRSECNQDYLIVSVEHSGYQPQALGEEGGDASEPAYQNFVECIPADVPFRPLRLTPMPSIPGVQSAVVVGPPGEEIHCDEHGRVKVQFHWDREGKGDDSSSCWIRVSQPWGGVSYGGLFLPRIGQEVLVQFLEGDPDRPVIVGRVYNGENPLPYSLPEHKTRSTIKSSSSPGGNGYNEFRFEDAAGKEEIWLHGQLDMNTVIERDRTQQFGRDTTDTIGRDHRETIARDRTRSVGRNESISIGADRTKSIGANQTLSVGANETIAIAGNQATQIDKARRTHIKGNDNLAVDGAQDIAIGGDQAIQIRGAETLKVTDDQTIEVTGAISIKSATEIKLACGAGSITIEQSGNIVIKGPLVKINC